MRNLSFIGDLYGEKVKLIQIQKRAAQKLYDAGESVYLCPCKFVPLGVWNIGCLVSNKYNGHEDVTVDDNKSFEHVVNSFSFYNCNSEAGLYITFYRVEKLWKNNPILFASIV